MDLEKQLRGKRVCVVAGSGGVGKTSTSAAIALGMAARGHKVAVLTIDPAKRLADSLGLTDLDTDLKLVDNALFAEHGIDVKGEFYAAMLDAKSTFDSLIARHAPDEQTRDRILGNRIYQELSNALAGSQEYMAMEKLLELHETSGCDLLILDTPPSRNAIDFLDAPNRLARFVDGRSLRLFLAPSRFGLRIAGRGSSLVFSALQRVTGVDLLGDLSEFFQSFSGMAAGFSERARRVEELLASKRNTFLLVCSPENEPVDEAIFFRRKLREDELPFGGAIVNKVHPDYRYARKKNGDDFSPELTEKLHENYERQKLLGRRDAENIARLEKELSAKQLVRVPLFAQDIHGVEGLVAMVEHLFVDA
ncbi:MAG: ArsA family ATPase [Thermoleophilaceae bacterium]|nr:ArsA family ATPase [Thermoleophilaceae bacterium]